MSLKASSRHKNLQFSGDIGHVSENSTCESSRRYPKSRFAKEKAHSPRRTQSLKFKDKVKAEHPIRPPHADLPLDFVKDENGVFHVQAKSSGDEDQPQVRQSVSHEDELIKYMSKVPGFLQRGETLQDNVLNFGVLDWGRLEKWTNKQNKVSVSDRTDVSATGSCSTSTNGSSVASATVHFEALASQREQPTSSKTDSFQKVDCSPVIKPLSGKTISHTDLVSSYNCSSDGKKDIRRKDKPQRRDGMDFKSAKGKEKHSDEGSSLVRGSRSTKLSKHGHKVPGRSKKKISPPDGEPEKYAEKCNNLHHSGKQDGIVLLLPKDFSREASSEVPPRLSLDGKSAELNWGSFSDIFSIDEVQSDKAFADIAYSCPPPYPAEAETELDLKLDNLIKAQGVEIPDMQSHLDEDNMMEETSTSTTLKPSSGLDQRTPSFSAELASDGSTSHRFSFSLARMTRSLSFKEGLGPQLRPNYMTTKSGPAKPEGSADCETPRSNKADTNGKTRNSPFKRLLDPLLKNKIANQMKDHSNDMRNKPPIAVQMPDNEGCEVSTIKALLYLTVKSGLPLFKLVVETKNEILASTVKSLSPFGKNDSRWLYTFYSVQQVRKKSSGWKNRKVKTCGLSYNVIGQMKVSNPHVPSWCEQKSEERHMVKESILYSVDLSKAENASSEFMASRELAAIVAKVPNDISKSGRTFSECFPSDRSSNLKEDEILGSTVIILPSGMHSLPNEGVPSPLINRWRSGGLCDCGGWDVGCKLRILTDQVQDHKTLTTSAPFPTQVRCDLFEQGEAKQRGPLFSLIPFRDGLFSVEFDAKISSLQAFSICVALINSHSSYSTNGVELIQELEREKASMILQGEGPEKHAPHPPLSPVGRV